MKKVTAVLIMAGLRRAEAYAEYALKFPNELENKTVFLLRF